MDIQAVRELTVALTGLDYAKENTVDPNALDEIDTARRAINRAILVLAEAGQ